MFAEEAAAAVAQDKVDMERLLTAEEILAADDIKYVTVQVPEWKGSVRIRTLSGEEVQEYLESIEGPAKRNALAIMVMRSAVKADGSQLFADPQKLGALKKRSMRAFLRLQEVILDLNGLTKAAQAAAKNG